MFIYLNIPIFLRPHVTVIKWVCMCRSSFSLPPIVTHLFPFLICIHPFHRLSLSFAMSILRTFYLHFAEALPSHFKAVTLKRILILRRICYRFGFCWFLHVFVWKRTTPPPPQEIYGQLRFYQYRTSQIKRHHRESDHTKNNNKQNKQQKFFHFHSNEIHVDLPEHSTNFKCAIPHQFKNKKSSWQWYKCMSS